MPVEMEIEEQFTHQQISINKIAEHLDTEWLLSNYRGSYSSSTVLGCNTRRYHGLLVASLHPPVERYVTLSTVLEKVTFGGESYELANFEFSDRLHPQGYRFLKSFWSDNGVHFLYELPGLTVEKSIYLSPEEDVVLVDYEFIGTVGEVELELVPLVSLRDFHGTQYSSASLTVEQNGDVFSARPIDPHGAAVHLRCPEMDFQQGPDWWYAMCYRQERRRGQNDYEDVWAPGKFANGISVPGRATLIAQATRANERPGPMHFDVDQVVQALREHNQRLIELSGAQNPDDIALVKAADQFIVRRQITEQHESASILAGFHWFADWGRDTFIALPGLLLCTGRYDEAREVLETFAVVVDQGMVPNRFDDYGGPPHYNSVDASLWFINAAYQYLRASGDEKSFYDFLRPTIAQITTFYEKGTRDNIHADIDGLINAGDVNTQLTWMDAKCNGDVFTPRYGKPVEINALWINALHIMAETAQEPDEKIEYQQMAERAGESFVRLFWNEQNNCLDDCVLPDGTIDAAIRPNQCFAVSLPFSCLNRTQQLGVVDVVREHLLTPMGLRSLSPQDSRYRSHYGGDQYQRDSAYHQGTVWGWLIGTFIEAYLKVNDFSDDARQQAAKMLEPLMTHFKTQACIASVSEVFDGEFPHHPGGCVAQAWSVGELIRSRHLLRK